MIFSQKIWPFQVSSWGIDAQDPENSFPNLRQSRARGHRGRLGISHTLRNLHVLYWDALSAFFEHVIHVWWEEKKRINDRPAIFFFFGAFWTHPSPNPDLADVAYIPCDVRTVRTRSLVRTVRGCSTPMHGLRWRSFRSTPSEVPRYSGQICGQKNLKSAVETREFCQFPGERQCLIPQKRLKVSGTKLVLWSFLWTFWTQQDPLL